MCFIVVFFMTGGENPMLAKEAYKRSVQGFFLKRTVWMIMQNCFQT